MAKGKRKWFANKQNYAKAYKVNVSVEKLMFV